MAEKQRIGMGSTVAGYTVIAMSRDQCVLAHNRTPNVPEPYVVWHLDPDGDPYGGHYFKDLDVAGQCFSQISFT